MMETTVYDILLNGSTFHLCALLVAGLFFAMLGWRELQDERIEGLLFIALSIFFVCWHFIYLFTLPSTASLSLFTTDLNIWVWLGTLLAPALIALFLLFGLMDFFRSHMRPGLVKLFFGLTLLCYLYMIGQAWPLDVKAFIAITWCFIWFLVEVNTLRT